MNLKRTPVSKSLDKKLRLLGFEIPDLLVLVTTIAVLNFLFGESVLKPYVVWLPAAVLAAVLHFGKKGKPDNFLIHWIRYQIKPGTFSAFTREKERPAPPKFLKGKK